MLALSAGLSFAQTTSGTSGETSTTTTTTTLYLPGFPTGQLPVGHFFSETHQGIDLLHLVRVTAIGDAFPDRLIAMPFGRLIACTFRRSLASADR